MRILPAIVFAYAMYKIFTSNEEMKIISRNDDNSISDGGEIKYLDANGNEVDLSLIEDQISNYEDKKDDLLQLEQFLDSETLSTYTNPSNIQIKPMLSYGQDWVINQLDIYNSDDDSFSIGCISENLYVRIDHVSIFNEKDATATCEVNGKEYQFQNVEKYAGKYYTMLENYFPYMQNLITIPAKRLCQINIPLDRTTELYTPPELLTLQYRLKYPNGITEKFTDMSDYEIYKRDLERINNALEIDYGSKYNGASESLIEDFMYANILLYYKQKTKSSNKTYWAKTIYQKIPVTFAYG